ncbi:MAG: hypothetical protein M3O70_21125 [Actinomycetota bacterium]|nr:hypothetical protein [Actinomycetota bacterium]
MSTSQEPSDHEQKPDAAKRRKPSTGFPVVPLPEAAKIVREAGKYGFEHSVSAFARYMGHSTTNSGSFRQRLAAFRDWKLIAGRGDTVVFTDTAKTIALPPDSRSEREALETAFMNCAVFAALYEGVAKGQPIDAQNLGAKAVHELGVSPSAVDRFTASFIDSAVAAGLAEADNGQFILLDPNMAAESARAEADDAGIAADGPTAEPARGRARFAQPPPVVHQAWTLPAGAVVFEVRLDRPLPAAVFAQVGAVVQEIEALADRLRELVVDETEG